MDTPLTQLTQALARSPAVLVRVEQTEGSAPREVGAWMAVVAIGTVEPSAGGQSLEPEVPMPDPMAGLIGSIGGGHLEWDAQAHALSLLTNPALPADTVRVALGPSLGQCCGGVVHLRYTRLSAADLPALASTLRAPGTPVALFGGGHVGRAIARQLLTLPFALHWIDSRDEIFPSDLQAAFRCEHSDPVQAAVDDVAPGSRVLIMSFSHAEDLEILARCLLRVRARDDLPYIGLIGSRSKWATFRHRLEARGFGADDFARVTCPIGLPGIAGKQPEVIAVAVAAQLLQTITGS